MWIVKNERVCQSARILPIHVKEVTNEENKRAFSYAMRINKSFFFPMIKRAPGYDVERAGMS